MKWGNDGVTVRARRCNAWNEFGTTTWATVRTGYTVVIVTISWGTNILGALGSISAWFLPEAT